MIQQERVQWLTTCGVRKGRFVLYWMQASQRAEWNHALEFAIEHANEMGQPLVCLFGITDTYPEANLRHYAFMLEGLRETQISLRNRGIQLVVRHQSPEDAAVDLARDASLLVMDCGYTRVQQMWREYATRHATCPVAQVEADVIVPIGVVSAKEEYTAATIRPKIHRHLDRFLVPLKERRLKKDSLGLRLGGLDLSDVDTVLAGLHVDRRVARQGFYIGGTSRAKDWLDGFIAVKLRDYAAKRSDPSIDLGSNMSPYLQFGQISPLYIAMRVKNAAGVAQEAKDAYLEELIIRRELSMNFVYHDPAYDAYRCLPGWARATLEKHSNDKRDYVYTSRELEEARTHDPLWNAAMREMVVTGKMANYMRMYWGKKILEWTTTPKAAFRMALRLNNKYFLDGRNSNSFAGVAWCFGKHDRPWGERPIFGNVRYMNAAGLRRKFDMDAYVSQVENLASRS
jgi:deoxyribodipyrimidine photo-lyase